MKEFMVTGEAMARQICQQLIGVFASFELSHCPDDQWRFIVQDEPNVTNVFEQMTDGKLIFAYIAAARRNPLVVEGRLEVYSSALISMGEKPGAYVQSWLWVDERDVDFNELFGVTPAFGPEPNHKCCAEGWAVFDTPNGRRQIRRIQNMGLFASDADAVAHVTAHAEQGSAYHAAALAYVAHMQIKD